ncbi:hypothetical protein [Streptosporangium sp. CA-115845]
MAANKVPRALFTERADGFPDHSTLPAAMEHGQDPAGEAFP